MSSCLATKQGSAASRACHKQPSPAFVASHAYAGPSAAPRRFGCSTQSLSSTCSRAGLADAAATSNAESATLGEVLPDPHAHAIHGLDPVQAKALAHFVAGVNGRRSRRRSKASDASPAAALDHGAADTPSPLAASVEDGVSPSHHTPSEQSIESALLAANAAADAADAAAAASAAQAEAGPTVLAPRKRVRKRVQFADGSGPQQAASNAAPAAPSHPPPSTTTNTPTSTNVSSSSSSSSSSPASSDSSNLDARMRIRQLRESLYRSVQSEYRNPSPSQVQLLLEPVKGTTPPPSTSTLRAEPLGPRTPPKKAFARTQAAEGVEGSSSNRTLVPKRRRRGVEGNSSEELTAADEGWVAGLRAGRRPEAEGSGERVERARGRWQEQRREQQEEQQQQGPKHIQLLKPRLSRQQQQDLEQQREAERKRAEEVRQQNEQYASFVEEMAASVEKAVGSKGASSTSSSSTTSAPSSMSASALAAQRAEEERREREMEERQRKEQEEASLLRGLAQMFRNFAAKANPAAAVASAVTPAAAALAGVGPRTSPRRAAAAAATAVAAAAPVADKVKLMLEPIPEVAAANAAAAAKSAAQRRVAARQQLMTLLRPMPKAKLPTYTRRVGFRLLSKRRPRVLKLSKSGPAAAGLLRPDGELWAVSAAEVRALRRQAYYKRVLRPQMRGEPSMMEQARRLRDAKEVEQQVQQREQQQQQQDGVQGAAEGTEQLPGKGTEGGVELDAAQAAKSVVRPRYGQLGRSFVLRERVQYSDRVKQVVRKAGFAAVGAAAVGGAAKAATLQQEQQQKAKQQLEEEEEDKDEEEEGQHVEEDQDEGEAEEADPRGEYNPAAEVVNDVYEQVMGVRLPERALYGRRAEVLAALSPKQVKDLAKSWMDACGRDYAIAFHSREPLLLAMPAEQLLLSLETLSRVFELEPERCVEVALRSPQLLGLPAEQIEGTVLDVSETLEVGMEEARKIVLRLPMLVVRQPSFPVSRRVELLGALLPVSRDKLRQVLRLRPLLLMKSLKNLAQFMMAASTELGLPLFDVAVMIAGSPAVTGVNSARLGARWRLLRAAACRHRTWQAQFAELSPPGMGRCLVANEAAIARLNAVVDAGLATDPAFFKFKRVITGSNARFARALEQAKARQQRRGGSGSGGKEGGKEEVGEGQHAGEAGSGAGGGGGSGGGVQEGRASGVKGKAGLAVGVAWLFGAEQT